MNVWKAIFTHRNIPKSVHTLTPLFKIWFVVLSVTEMNTTVILMMYYWYFVQYLTLNPTCSAHTTGEGTQWCDSAAAVLKMSAPYSLLATNYTWSLLNISPNFLLLFQTKPKSPQDSRQDRIWKEWKSVQGMKICQVLQFGLGSSTFTLTV